jgi:hypothetical protein
LNIKPPSNTAQAGGPCGKRNKKNF